MKPGRSRWLACVIGVVVILSGCAKGPDTDGGSFRQDYAAARTALEGGDYSRAVSLYGRMIEAGAGPLEPRLRLELAHALLRADRFEEAAAEAATLAGSQSGAGRAAALAIVGTARHEQARQRMASGDFGAQTEVLLQSAQAALGEMLAGHGDLDPQGAMAARHKTIARDLSDLLRYRAGGG